MESYTTIRITRSTARRYFFSKRFNISDDELEDILSRELSDDCLYDVKIVDDGNGDNQDYILD